MRNILVLGNSEAAKAIKQYYVDDNVEIWGRTTSHKFELEDIRTWPTKSEIEQFDEIHYTVHARTGLSQMEYVTPLIRRLSQVKQLRLVVYSSLWGSITLTDSVRWNVIMYKMTKAALNMLCKTLSTQKETLANILLLHPGPFKSSLNPDESINVFETMSIALKYVDKWDNQFKFMDGRNGEEIPF